MSFVVRKAEPKDADAAVDVLRRSIMELCTLDHRGDADTLAKWLANKTRENVLGWLAKEDNFCVVAESSDRILGVGLIHRGGEIRLCYVAPGAQGQGVGKAIYLALEKQARAWGVKRLSLDSTVAARSFYEKAGFRPAGAARPGFGISLCHPYEKPLHVEIRPAHSEEAAALSALAMQAKAYWGYPAEALERWRAELAVSPAAVGERPVMVAAVGTRIVGFYSLRPSGESWELFDLWVLPEFMHQGIGRALLSHALATAARGGAGEVTVDADPHAESFYLRNGAARRGEVPAPIPGQPGRVRPQLAFDKHALLLCEVHDERLEST